MTTPTWIIDYLKDVKRGSAEWLLFVEWLKNRIIERLQRYNNADTVKTQLAETASIVSYQSYKITVVSKFLLLALNNLKNGNYGNCTQCGGEIPVERLLLVPGALRCMNCESGRLAGQENSDNNKSKE